MGFTDFGVVEFVGNTLASHFFAQVGMDIFGWFRVTSFPFFPVHMEMGLRHATPSTHAHTI